MKRRPEASEALSARFFVQRRDTPKHYSYGHLDIMSPTISSERLLTYVVGFFKTKTNEIARGVKLELLF